MDRNRMKRAAAEAAIDYVTPGTVIGVGTGSTADCFIAALAARPELVAATVASSEASATALRDAGIRVVALDEALPLPLYVDGADEVDPELRLIKGAGGALAREKVVASAAELFVCIVDESKLVERLGAAGSPGGRAPVPVAALPTAEAFVIGRLRALGATPAVRPGYRTDDGALVLDVAGLDLSDPERLETELDAIPGVLECGIFALRPADVVLAGMLSGVRVLRRAPE